MKLPVTRGLSNRGPLPPLRKLGLAFEVMAVYLPTLRRLHRDDLRTMVAAARREWPAHAARSQESREGARAALRLGRAVQKTFRVLPTDTRCLVSSLVLSRLLARRGIDSTLIVAAGTQPRFTAHAWVEYARHPLLDPGSPEQRRLVEL